MAKRLASKRKPKNSPPAKKPQAPDFPLYDEVSTVSAYLFNTYPYRYNPDDLIGKKGIKIYNQMIRDEQIKSAMLAKVMSVLSPGWEIAPPEYEDQKNKDKASELVDFLQFNLGEMEGTFDNRLWEMLSALVYGFSVGEKVFYLIDYGPHKGKIGLRDLKFRNPDGIYFRTDQFGNLDPFGVQQSLNFLPSDKFVIYSYRKKFSNYYGDSDLRDCYRPWWMKDNFVKFMAIALERYGEPTWVFTTKGPIGLSNRIALENFMRDLQSKSGLIIPEGVTVKPEHPAPDVGRQFTDVLEYCDQLIRIALLVPGLLGFSSEGSVGSYARSQTEFNAFVAIMEYLRADIESNVNEQLVKQLIDFNFDITDGKYPLFKFKSISEEDKQKQFDNYIAGLNAKAITKTREDENALRKSMEFPPLADDIPVAGTLEAQAAAMEQAQQFAPKPEPSPGGGGGGGSQAQPGKAPFPPAFGGKQTKPGTPPVGKTGKKPPPPPPRGTSSKTAKEEDWLDEARVIVYAPDGTLGHIPADQYDDALEQGYRAYDFGD